MFIHFVLVLECEKGKYSKARPRTISNQGPQFISKDFKEFIRVSGMIDVRTFPYCPQRNVKLKSWHKTLKGGYAVDQVHHFLFKRRGKWLKD